MQHIKEVVNGIFQMQAALQEHENNYANVNDDKQELVDSRLNLDSPIQFPMQIAQALLSDSPIIIKDQPCQSIAEGLTKTYRLEYKRNMSNKQSKAISSIFPRNLDENGDEIQVQGTRQMKLVKYLKGGLPKISTNRLNMEQFEIERENAENRGVLKNFISKSCPDLSLVARSPSHCEFDAPFNYQYNPKCPQRVIQKTAELSNQSAHFAHQAKSNSNKFRKCSNNYNNNSTDCETNPNWSNFRYVNGIYQQQQQQQLDWHLLQTLLMQQQMMFQSTTKPQELIDDIGENISGLKRKNISTDSKPWPIDIDKKPKLMDKDMEKYEPLIGGDITFEIIKWVLKMKISQVDKVHETDLVGLHDVKKMVKDKIIHPILRPDLHKGLHRAPKGILFFGPPGTGKTTLAKWIACQSNATFFQICPSSITSKYHGETESIIRTLFIIAELNAPSVVFIDEVDSVLAKRKNSEEDHSIRMKNQLLQMMDGLTNKTDSTVIVVAATNRPEILDDAALRRFTRRILIPLPDHESRMLFIKNILFKHQNSLDLKDEHLVEISDKTKNWSGSDLLNLCTKAAEFSYDETIEKHSGIENVPDSSAFRLINIEDFRKSLDYIKPSSYNNGNLCHWESCFGSR